MSHQSFRILSCTIVMFIWYFIVVSFVQSLSSKERSIKSTCYKLCWFKSWPCVSIHQISAYNCRQLVFIFWIIFTQLLFINKNTRLTKLMRVLNKLNNFAKFLKNNCVLCLRAEVVINAMNELNSLRNIFLSFISRLLLFLG